MNGRFGADCLGRSISVSQKRREQTSCLSRSCHYPRDFGAAVGLLGGHRRKWMARHKAQTEVAQASQQAQQATATEPENFMKAFAVCLEGKDHLLKY